MMIKDRPSSPSNRPHRLNPIKKLKIHTVLSGYLRHRCNDLWGRPDRLKTTDVWIDAMLRESSGGTPPEDAPSTRVGNRPSSTPPVANEAVVSPALMAARLRQQYEAEAPFVRAFLGGAVVSVLVFGHRWWLNDWAGAGASLGAFFTILALSLPSAHRCWQIRHRTLDSPRQFLRHPSRWWPFPLPDDDAP